MKFEAQAFIRTAVGKGPARQIRREGAIPGVLYGQGKVVSIMIQPAIVRTILLAQGGSTALINLQLQDQAGSSDMRMTVIQNYQRDPITSRLLHVDFFEVSMTKPLRVKVQVRIMGGTPIGVKRDKGVLHLGLRELHIECLPEALPDHIDVDASALAVNRGIYVSDLQPGAGVKILDEATMMVVNVSVPISDQKLASMLTGEAGAPVVAGTPAPVADKGKT